MLHYLRAVVVTFSLAMLLAAGFITAGSQGAATAATAGVTVQATDFVPTRIDWCSMARSGKYGKFTRQRVLGECAHIKFSAKYDGDRVKYTRDKVSVVPDGKTDKGRVLMELKPNGTAARSAAKKTARSRD